MLEPLAREAIGSRQALYVPTLAAAGEGETAADRTRMVESLGLVWMHGGPVNWSAQYKRPAEPTGLPGYPFERHVHWLSSLRHEMASGGSGIGRGLEARWSVLATGQVSALTDLALASAPFLGEHRVHGRAVVPAVAFMELLLRGAEQLLEGRIGIRNLTLTRPLVLADDASRTVQVVAERIDASSARIRAFALSPREGWQQCLEAEAVARDPDGDGDEEDEELEDESFQRARGRCRESFEHEDFYREAWHPHFELGPSFQLIESAQRGRGTATGYVRVPDPECAASQSGVRPDVLLLDTCVQLVAVAADQGDERGPQRPVRVGTGCESMTLLRDLPEGDLRCTAVLRDEKGNTADAADTVIGDVSITDLDGLPVAEVRGVSFRTVAAETLDRLLATGSSGPLPGPSALASKPRRAGVPRLNSARLRAATRQTAAAQLTTYLIALVASIQGRPAAEVTASAQLAGSMDSLMLVELLAAIEGDAGLRLTMEDLFDVDDIAGLAEQIADRLREQEPAPAASPAASVPVQTAQPRPAQPLPRLRTGRLTSMTPTEMAELAELDGSIAASAEPLPPETAPRGTFLTGATGFVGAFLLEQTLARTDGDVYCLVRAGDERTALGRILDNLTGYGIDLPHADRSRIIAVPGDLARPGLGLDENTAARIYERCGSIQHCGGIVKWTYPYKTLAPANVDGTREILRLAVRGGTPRPVHFISTVGVFSSAEFGQDEVAEDQPLATSGPLVVGYAQSKWVAERMMHTAHDRGIPTTIHRINTGAHSVTGAFNRLDHLNIMIKGCIEAGIAPDSLNVQLQPAPIDYVAAAVVEAAARPALHGRTFHLVNDSTMGWPEFFGAVSELGYPLELVPFDTWRARITGADAGTMALLGLVPFLVDAVDDVRVPLSRTAATREALAGTGLACPPLDRELIHTYLRRFAAARFIEPPKGSRRADHAAV